MPTNNIQPDGWARPRGYSNGVVANGPLLFVAGQVGWDPTNPVPTFASGFAEQFGQAYAPTYSVVFTFVILVLVLAFRPRGILGRPA